MIHPDSVAIIGAGPAGLTAGYLLSKEKVPVTILEADPHYVGGIARTAKYKGYHFDVGGHRFFSKSKEVEDLWTELSAQRHARSPSVVADLLQRQVLLLSAQGRRGPVQARHLRIGSLRPVVLQVAHGSGSSIRRTSRTGSATSSANGSSTSSSRPIPKKSGA